MKTTLKTKLFVVLTLLSINTLWAQESKGILIEPNDEPTYINNEENTGGGGGKNLSESEDDGKVKVTPTKKTTTVTTRSAQTSQAPKFQAPKPEVKAKPTQVKKEDNQASSVLSFNFIHYIIKKFKYSDIFGE
ncbi:MAG: hypothetical protein AAFX87_00590 [Bacteroidota bacterium]